MNAETASIKSSNLVLRVVSGKQVGAEYRLSAGLVVRIGHGFAHDIVLRTPNQKDCSIELTVDEPLPMMKMLGGTASLLGRPLQAGDNAPLPLYMPVTIGDMSFAIGDADSDRWAEAAVISEAATYNDSAAPTTIEPQMSDAAAPAVPTEIANSDGAQTAISAQLNGAMQLFQQRFQPFGTALAIERRWPIYAIAAATLLLAAILFAPVSSWVSEQFSGPAATQDMLNRAGFKDVKVSQSPDGTLLVRGIVRDDPQLNQLRSMVSSKSPSAVLDVKTHDGIAAAVTDMLTAQGLDAQAKAGRNNSMVVTSEYLPGDRQEELIAQIKKDMPFLKQISFTIDPKRGEPMLQYFFSSEKFGIATFVDGDPSYIRTADGTTWMKGAVVPTGHEIIDIGNGRVRFSREGKIEELVISADAQALEAEAETKADINSAPKISANEVK